MIPVIINGRWSLDGIAVPYADFFSILMFRVYIKRAAMLQPVPIRGAGFKTRPAEVKRKYNHKFPPCKHR